MKSIGKALAIALLGITLSYPETSEAQEKFVNIGYTTRTVLSGFTPVPNPGINLGTGYVTENFSFNVWANYDPDIRNGLQEVDLNLTIPFKIADAFDTNFYAGYFSFPNSDFIDSQEVGVTLSTTTLPFNLNVYAAQLFWDGGKTGNIVKTSIGKHFELSDIVNIGASGKIVWNGKYFNNHYGLSHAQFAISSTFAIDNVSISPAITYQRALDTENFGDVFRTQTYGSVNLRINF